MNLSNKLTCLRMILIVPFLILSSLKFYTLYGIQTGWNIFSSILALIVFAIACASDYYDGKIARETNTITDFGKMMDPIADKLITFTFLFVLVKYDKMSVLLVFIMLLREILVTYERIQLVKKGCGVLPAAKIGKIKTVVIMITIAIILIIPDFIFMKILNDILIIPGLILTVYSGVEYHMKAVEELKEGYDE